MKNLSRSALFFQLCATGVSSASLRGGRDEQGAARLLAKGSRIVGGREANEGRYSYAVSLEDRDGQFCGGSLIAPDVVLSAAHCSGGKYKAVIGRHDLRKNDGDEVDIEREMEWPGYDYDEDDGDFMLLFLKRPTSARVDLVEVGSDFVNAGTKVTVVGWGLTDPSGDSPDELREVEVTTISNNDCDASSGRIDGSRDDYKGAISGNMLCAEDRGKDSCNGDSGGPLVVRGGPRDVQVGVVSWGISCAHRDFPGVYARVSAQYEWIKENVCKRSADPPAWFRCDGGAGRGEDAGKVDDEAPGEESPSSVDEESPVQVQPDAFWAFGAAPPDDSEQVARATSLFKEEFYRGFGLFTKRGTSAQQYAYANNRLGVVRLWGEDDGTSITSQDIPVSGGYKNLKISLSFMVKQFRAGDSFCIEYEVGNSRSGSECWNAGSDFINGIWYKGKSISLDATGVTKLVLTLRVKSTLASEKARVLVDSVTVEGSQ